VVTTNTVSARMVAQAAESVEWPALARVARVVAAGLDPDAERGDDAALQLAAAAERAGDSWGHATICLAAGLAGAHRGLATAPAWLTTASSRFQALGAPVLSAWADGALAVVLALAGDSTAAAAAAEVSERALSLGLPRLFDLLALGDAGPTPLPAPAPARAAPRRPSAPVVTLPREAVRPVLRCFGRFEIRVGGELVDTTILRPRAQALLHLLALQRGRGVHREVLIEALWPDSGPAAGLRSLQVAASSVRRLLSESPVGGPRLERTGDAYRLDLPADIDCDLVGFEQGVARARQAVAAGRSDDALVALDEVLVCHHAPLLDEDGPVDWAVDQRAQYLDQAVWAVGELARIHLACGRPGEAAAACAQGLRWDRYRDELWRLSESALDATGDVAAARLSRLRYREVLDELGISGPDLQAVG
jgi:DNA-binding SARP family transcriptional activator